MNAYEITWHVEMSSDEAAQDIYDTMNRVMSAAGPIADYTLTLKKVLRSP